MAVRQEKEVVCVLPDGQESFHNVYYYDGRSGWSYEEAANRAVRDAGLKTPRKDPQKVTVKVFSQTIEKGQMKRVNAGTFQIEPCLERMTDDEYDTEMKELLGEIPEAFRSFVSTQAYAEGHSAGNEEIVSLAGSLVHALKPAIEAYRKQLTGK